MVVQPGACHPSYAQGHYDRDNPFYLAWDEVARDPDRLDAWLREWVFDLATHDEYLSKMGERWTELCDVGDAPSGSVNYGRYA